MNYDLAMNFDMALLDYIEEHDTKLQVTSMFGKLKEDYIGGGRSSSTLPEVSKDELQTIVNRCNRMGIKFNYLMNPMCIANKDVISDSHHMLLDFIGEIHEMGIPAITVNSPYLCEIIKQQYPDMWITIGLYAMVTGIQQIDYWIRLGADEITLPHAMNRDFEMLEHVLSAFRNTNVNFRLIANNACLHDCPFAVNHANGVSHSSAADGKGNNKYIDYNILNCYRRKVLKPVHLICSDWIRPEDVHYYDELCEKTGNRNLIIKLVERSKGTEFLSNVLQAFLDEKYEGNLRELFNWVDTGNAVNKNMENKELMEDILAGKMDAKSIYQYLKFFTGIPNVIIDNQKLDGFLLHFMGKYPCRNKPCWTENFDPPEGQTKYCTYCYGWTKRAVHYPEDCDLDKWRDNAEKLFENLRSSKIFGRKEA